MVHVSALRKVEGEPELFCSRRQITAGRLYAPYQLLEIMDHQVSTVLGMLTMLVRFDGREMEFKKRLKRPSGLIIQNFVAMNWIVSR